MLKKPSVYAGFHLFHGASDPIRMKPLTLRRFKPPAMLLSEFAGGVFAIRFTLR